MESSYNESIIIKNLGAIDTAEINPRPLTVLVGSHASGKSLITQLLYFFRGLKEHLGYFFSPELMEINSWYSKSIEQLLDDLRGASFKNFVTEKAILEYKNDDKEKVDWLIKLYRSDRKAGLNDKLRRKIKDWGDQWFDSSDTIINSYFPKQHFISAGRSMFSYLLAEDKNIFSDPSHSLIIRRFAQDIKLASELFQILSDPLKGEAFERALAYQKLDDLEELEKSWNEKSNFIKSIQRKVLSGEAIVQEEEEGCCWKWKDNTGKLLPLKLISSGQRELWPYFAITSTFGAIFTGHDYYFDEPETNLDPMAQAGAIQSIVSLVNQGNRFTISTHSSFILSLLDNMIKKYQINEESGINPANVAVYHLKKDRVENIMDYSDRAGIKLHELDRINNELKEKVDQLF